MDTILSKIEVLLQKNNCTYKKVSHRPTFTSEESAVVRGEPLEYGAKALLIKADECFVILVMSAAQKLDSKKARHSLGVKKIRFATQEELKDLTGLVPGSVPPFGIPILPFTLYVDTSIAGLARVAFNAGSLEVSIIMETTKYLKICNGKVIAIT
jgi:Ala-tRNA(Pro) deacylase